MGDEGSFFSVADGLDGRNGREEESTVELLAVEVGLAWIPVVGVGDGAPPAAAATAASISRATFLSLSRRKREWF